MCRVTCEWFRVPCRRCSSTTLHHPHHVAWCVGVYCERIKTFDVITEANGSEKTYSFKQQRIFLPSYSSIIIAALIHLLLRDKRALKYSYNIQSSWRREHKNYSYHQGYPELKLWFSDGNEIDLLPYSLLFSFHRNNWLPFDLVSFSSPVFHPI